MIRKIYGILLLGAFLFSASAQAYEMPIGIPAPSFGGVLGNSITVTNPPNPAGWPNQEVAGYYYVDSSDSNATDSGNTYGYPDKPRSSLPLNVPAGSVVEVRGGPYNYADANISMNGSSSSPVFFYGVGKPVINATRTNLSGGYFVFDGFEIVGRILSSGLSYATIRNSDIHGPNIQNGVTLNGNHVVFYNNDVHHHQGDDKHGVTVTSGSSYIWVLNNLLHHNGGDGIQFCHGCSTNPPQFVYIGRNTAYSNRENGIDLKYARNVVISQNESHSHRAISDGEEFCYDDGSGCTTGSSGSDGASIIVGSDGAPSNVWTIFNHVHDSNKGIRIEEAYDGVVMGNLIHDVDSIGIEFEKTGEGPNTVAFNTIHNTNVGIKGPWQGGSLVLRINNNILSNISGASLSVDENWADSTANHNLFYNNGGDVTVLWHTSSTVSSGSAINSKVGGTGNLIGNPMFRSPGSGDFSVVSGGAGIDRANSDLITLNNQFTSIFGSGSTVLRDYVNNARSATGSDHDIGAFESDGAPGNAPPSAPTLLE